MGSWAMRGYGDGYGKWKIIDILKRKYLSIIYNFFEKPQFHIFDFEYNHAIGKICIAQGHLYIVDLIDL